MQPIKTVYSKAYIERKKNKMLVYNKEKSTTQPGVLYCYRINKDTFDSRETPFSQERNTTNVGSCGKEWNVLQQSLYSQEREMSRTTEQIKETTSVMRDITTLRGPYITERNSTLVTLNINTQIFEAVHIYIYI